MLWPSIGSDGKTIVFERNFQVWKLDTASGRAGALNIVRRGAPAGPRFDRNEYESKGALRITEVNPLTPAAITNLKVAEYLVAVDGAAIGAHRNPDELLAYKIGKRVALTIALSADGAQKPGLPFARLCVLASLRETG